MEIVYFLIGMVLLLLVIVVVFVIVLLKYYSNNKFEYYRDNMSINGGANVENGVYTSEGAGLMNSENMRTIIAAGSSDVLVRLVEQESRADYGVISLLRPVTIGSASGSADIKLADNTVSRYHCSLFSNNGIVFIEDLNSKNGTYVNGGKITGKMALKSGDILGIGYKRLVLLTN